MICNTMYTVVQETVTILHNQSIIYMCTVQGRYPYGAESRQGWLSDSPVSDYDEGYSLYRSEVMVITHFTGERSWSLLTR